MATSTTISAQMAETADSLSVSSTRFDRLYAGLAAFFVIGLFIDGWAHNHGRVDESFFTPWHAIFYSGFTLVAILLVGRFALNRRKGLTRGQAVPAGYSFSMLGVFIFAGGGLADLAWHEIFGIEEDVEALLSPSHMLLVIGMVLIAFGPYRAALMRREKPAGWGGLFPAVLAVLLAWSVLTFITQFAHPMIQPWPAIGTGSESMKADLFIMNADGSGQTRLTNSLENYDTQPSFSPVDGRILFSSEGVSGYEIYTMNQDGTGLQQLTDNLVQDWSPAWSPDGRQIAYAGEQDGQMDLFIMDAAGGPAHNLTQNEMSEWGPDWSPDGDRIAFQAEVDGEVDVFLIHSDGTGLTNLTGSALDGWQPVWSPDGQSLLFLSDRDGRGDLYVMEVESKVVRKVDSGPMAKWSPSWSPNGDQIAFVSGFSGSDEIYLVEAGGGEPVNISNNPAMEVGFPRWSADGSRIIYRAWAGGSGDEETGQALGMANIVLQSALMAAAAMLLVGRFRLPFGVFTLLFGLNAFGMAFMDDEFRFLPAFILAGLLGDWLVYRLRLGPGALETVGRFAFLVSLAAIGMYFATLFITDEVVWSIHFWAGAVLIAGLIGWLTAFLFRAGSVKFS